MADPNTTDLVICPLEDLGGLIRTAFHSGDPARPGLEVCEIAHHLPDDERHRLSALFATAPDLAAENARIRALYLEAERALTDALSETGRLRDLRGKLVGALERLIKAYQHTLRLGYERITELGGSCDAPEVMEDGDPELRSATAALRLARGEGR